MSQRKKLERAIGEIEGSGAPGFAEGREERLAVLRARLAALTLSNPAGRRRQQVTALSLHMPGSGAASGTWLPALVYEYGGVFAWRAGDHGMAIWGEDARREGDPDRAIRAALAIREALHRSGGEGLRMGLCTGTALVGTPDETRECEAWGEAMDAAALLEATAPEDGILISESTYRHVRGVFKVAPQQGLAMEGRSEWLGVYLLEGVKPRAFLMPIRGVGNIETRTVGRDREFGSSRTCTATRCAAPPRAWR